MLTVQCTKCQDVKKFPELNQPGFKISNGHQVKSLNNEKWATWLTTDKVSHAIFTTCKEVFKPVVGIRIKIQGRKVQFEKNQCSEKLASCMDSDLLHGAHLIFSKICTFKFFQFFGHRIRNTVKYQCCISMTFWCGSGSGSTDPCLWLMIRIWMRFRILLFLSWTFKMPIKTDFL